MTLPENRYPHGEVYEIQHLYTSLIVPAVVYYLQVSFVGCFSPTIMRLMTMRELSTVFYYLLTLLQKSKNYANVYM